MAKQVSTFNYRKLCIRQGRDNIPTLTRKQKKALKQHDAATAGKDQSATGYKAKTTVILDPRFNILGEIVGFVRKER